MALGRQWVYKRVNSQLPIERKLTTYKVPQQGSASWAMWQANCNRKSYPETHTHIRTSLRLGIRFEAGHDIRENTGRRSSADQRKDAQWIMCLQLYLCTQASTGGFTRRTMLKRSTLAFVREVRSQLEMFAVVLRREAKICYPEKLALQQLYFGLSISGTSNFI